MSLRRSGVVLSPIDRSDRSTSHTSTSTPISSTSAHLSPTPIAPSSLSSPLKPTSKSATSRSYQLATPPTTANVYALRDTIKYLTQQNNTLTDRLKALRSATSKTLRCVRPTTQPLTPRTTTTQPLSRRTRTAAKQTPISLPLPQSPANVDKFSSSPIESQIQEEIETALSALKVASAKLTQLQQKNIEKQQLSSRSSTPQTQTQTTRIDVGCQVSPPLATMAMPQKARTLTLTNCSCGRAQEIKTLRETISELEEELVTAVTTMVRVAPLDREYELLRSDNNRLVLQLIDLDYNLKVARTLYQRGTIDGMSQIQFLKCKLEAAADRESVLKKKMRKNKLRL